MRIKLLRDKYNSQYPNIIKVIRKWNFWIILNEEAFFFAQYFNFKITKLDKENIKIWFPVISSDKRLNKLNENLLWYVIIDKEQKDWWEYYVKSIIKWKYFTSIWNVNLEDYELTKKRILWLASIWLEEKTVQNFLLKEKLEQIYILLSMRMIKMPRKERYYFRDKIEIVFMDMMEQVYRYMYNLWNRKTIIELIFEKVIIIREFTRFLHKIWKIANDNVFLDLWDRWIEVMKICKWIKNKIE